MGDANSDNADCRSWRAVVPATTANLGCAFDCGGLALKLYLKSRFIPAQSSDLTLEYRGKTPERFPLEPSNLLLRALRFGVEKLGGQLPGGRMAVESEIPIGVGLGSSAASVIAGLLLATRVAGKEVRAEQLLGWAFELEGHIDNAAAAYYGGLVVALGSNVNRTAVAMTAFPESLRLVLVTPAVAVPTHEARGVLPRSYERADVVHTLQRTALLAAACFSGRFDFFPELFDDRLHQPYRKNLVPGIERCLQLRHKGLLGTVISGSGSTVLAFVDRPEEEAEIAVALQECFAKEGIKSEARFTTADNRGASVTRGDAGPADRQGQILEKAGKAL